MQVMLTIGLAAIMLVIGMILRAKIGFLRNILVPCCVIGGVIGMIVMNTGVIKDVTAGDFNGIVSQMFLISFMCVGLTGSEEKRSKDFGKNLVKGGLVITGVWGAVYCFQAVAGYLVMGTFSSSYGIAPEYGLLCPFGFAQGPGQANTFGTTVESYGYADAASVALTFAVTGFLIAFLIGVPMAKIGIAKGMARNLSKIDPIIARGYFKKEEEAPSMGRMTCFNGSIDSLTFHIALIGITYFVTHYLTQFIIYVCPESWTSTLMGFEYAIGMLTGMGIRMLMKALKVDFVKDDHTMRRLTGLSTDLLVICAFMAVQFSIVQKWIVPILVVCLVNTILTLGITVFFCQRCKCDYEFERSLFIWGMSTGTVPSGISLVRMADPDLKTTIPLETGIIQIGFFLPALMAASILSLAAGTQIFGNGLLFLVGFGIVQLLPLFLFRIFGKRVFTLRSGYIKR